jgi:hypothetical protein
MNTEEKTHLFLLKRFAHLFVVLALFWNSVALSNSEKVDSKESTDQPVVVLATEVKGESIEDVAKEIWSADPDALIGVPEKEADRFVPTENNAAKLVRDRFAKAKQIQVQNADSLNTLLLAIDYGYGNLVYILSPEYSWLQSASMVGFNMLYLKEMELKLGRWSLFLQKGGQAFAVTLRSLRLTNSIEAQIRAEKIGNFITHGFLNYLYFGIFQLMGQLPNLHDGFFGLEAQENILRKTGSGFLSGFGWAMLARKWDALPERERPISRQAFNAFNNTRSLVLGLFMPFLITASNDLSAQEFLLYNAPFIISAGTGTAFYFWGDAILARYPQITQSLNRFDKLTQRLNEKLNQVGQKIRKLPVCNWLLR